MKLLSPPQYVAQAAAAAKQAQKRIYLLSLVIADHSETHELFKELQAAAKRGVKVVVSADVFTYGELSGGFFPLRYYSQGVKAMKDTVKQLKQSGVEFHWLGSGRITLYHGRTHTKWCIIDDQVFSFGGINLYDEGINSADYMFHFKSESVADRLVAEQERIQKAERASKNYPGYAYESDGLTVLIDGGIIGQSIIYRRALELTEQSTQVTYVSQYCPTGRLARLIKKRQHVVYYNRPSQAKGANKIAIILGQFISGLTTKYQKEPYLHAKCMIFTLTDGSKVALSGSHNFSQLGVVLGTREVSLETRDIKIIRQLESFINNSLA